MLARFLIRTTAVAALTWAGAAQAAATLYGLTSANSGRNLVSFSSETPGTFSSNIAITGDVNTGVDLLSLDLNSSNGTLYALGSLGRGQYALFSIGFNGVATRIGANLGLNLGTENAGLDYDAATNLFRVVTNDDDVFTINPLTGVATPAGSFAYAPGDPRFGENPNVIAAAYNSQLYVIDRNGPGNSGMLSTLDGTTLNTVATLNRQINANASFDIAANGEAYFNSGQVGDRLYLLNLITGASIDKGALDMRLTGLTAGPGAAPVPEPATWATMVLGFAAIGAAVRRRHRIVSVPA